MTRFVLTPHEWSHRRSTGTTGTESATNALDSAFFSQGDCRKMILSVRLSTERVFPTLLLFGDGLDLDRRENRVEVLPECRLFVAGHDESHRAAA